MGMMDGQMDHRVVLYHRGSINTTSGIYFAFRFYTSSSIYLIDKYKSIDIESYLTEDSKYRFIYTSSSSSSSSSYTYSPTHDRSRRLTHSISRQYVRLFFFIISSYEAILGATFSS